MNIVKFPKFKIYKLQYTNADGMIFTCSIKARTRKLAMARLELLLADKPLQVAMIMRKPVGAPSGR